jgi:hypothetical protein
MRLKINGEKIDTCAENTVLFQFAGTLSMYNFVYVDGEENAARVFEMSRSGELYKKLAKEAIEGNYPAHTNMNFLQKDDMQAYESIALADVARLNSVPIEWQKAF